MTIREVQKYTKYYQAANLLFYLFTCACLVLAAFLSPQSLDSDLGIALFILICAGSIFLPLIFFHAYVALNIERKIKFIYYVTIMSLIMGLSNIITIVPAILLLLKWIEPQMREYYEE